MKSRETIILLVTVVLLGAFIYFYERHTAGTEEKSRRADRILPEFDRQNVTVIEIKSEKGSFVVRRVEKKPPEEKTEKEKGEREYAWKMEKPFEAKADLSVIDGILSDIEYMSEERRVEGEAARDVKKYGLDNPGLVIKIQAKDETLTLRAGKEAPGDGMYLAMEGKDGIVFVVSKYTVEAFVKDPAEVRDKQMTDLLPGELAGIKIFRAGSLQTGFERAQQKWSCSSPELGGDPVRVSRKKVEQLAGRLGSLRAESFLSDSATEKDLSDLGLGAGAVKIELTENGGTVTSILLGNECGGETKGTEGVAAFVRGTGTIACVGADIKSAALKPAPDYRLLTAVEFDEYDVAAFDAYAGGGDKPSLRIEKDGEENWRIKIPEEALADTDTVGQLIALLMNEKASNLLQEGIDPAAALLENVKMKLRFYGEGDMELETLFLAVSGDSKVFFRRENEKFWGELPDTAAIEDAHQPFHYYMKAVVKEDYYAAVGYTVKKRAAVVYHALARDAETGTWDFEKPSGLDPDPSDVRISIETFASLTAQRFLAPGSDQNLAGYGLDSPDWTVSAAFSESGEEEGGPDHDHDHGPGGKKDEEGKEGKEKTYEIIIGSEIEGGYAAMLKGGGPGAVFLMTQAVFKRLTRPLAARDVFQVDPDRIASIELSNKGGFAQYSLSNGEITLTGGTDMFGLEDVRAFIDKLGHARAADVTAYGPPAAESGLGSPSLKASFSLSRNEDETGGGDASAETKKTLVFGSKTRDGEGGTKEVYAAVEGIACTYTVGVDLLEPLGLDI
ncbi:MAG: DUF4340 domain-containing protein [Pseudomonadota bacterium]